MFPTGLEALEGEWPIPDFSTVSQMSSLIFGQNTDSLAFKMHFPLLDAFNGSVPRLSF